MGRPLRIAHSDNAMSPRVRITMAKEVGQREMDDVARLRMNLITALEKTRESGDNLGHSQPGWFESEASVNRKWRAA